MMTMVFNNCGMPFKEKSTLSFSDKTFVESATVSYQAFEKTVYPITRTYCVSCHSTLQPLHASADVKTAHDALVANLKVNFENIPSSRMVKKLRDDNHNCWSDCEANALEMETAIKEWKETTVDSDVPVDPIPMDNFLYTEQSKFLAEVMVRPPALTTLTYNLTPILGVMGISFKVDLIDFDLYSYKFQNPRIVTTSSNVKVRNVRLLVNNTYNPQHSTFTHIDKLATPVDGKLHDYAMLVFKDKGSAGDKISFAFEELKISTEVPEDPALIASENSFRTTVYPISRTNCISCHTVQNPPHAHDNYKEAHDVVVTQNLVDFTTPASSKLVTKVQSGHNCGTQEECDIIANQYMAAIIEWKKVRP